MNIDYIKKRIAEKGCKEVYIFHGNVKSMGTEEDQTILPCFSIPEGSPINEQIDTFSENFSGDFTVFLRSSKTQEFKKMERIQFHHKKPSTIINGAAQAVDVDRLRQQITSELLQQMQMEEYRRIALDAKKQWEEDRKPEARMANIIEKLFWSSQLKNATTSAPTQPINGTSTPLSEDDESNLDEAFEILVDAFGVDDMLRIAARIKSEPEIVNKLKLFL